MIRRSICLILVAFCGITLSSCSTNQATGQRQFTAFMPASSEAKIGEEEHGKIIKSYGVVDNPTLVKMVNQVGQRIVPFTERKDVNYTFTVLDSPEVNAFALPGGYVYVTRGLIAKANSEDELAAVIAHEIGHVTARHSAERYSRSVATGLGASVLAAVLDTPGANDLLGLGSNLYLSAYSRDQEHEADDLGVRYIARAGYDPDAMSDFLVTLERSSEFEQLLLGNNAKPRVSYFSTHPVTRDRISRSKAASAQTGIQAERVVEPYLRAINGMVFGDSPKQGYVYKSDKFVHPILRFAFTIPQGYLVKNSPQQVIIASRTNNAVGLMDGAKLPAGKSLENYVRSDWLKGKRLVDFQTTTIDGKPAILAQYAQRIKGQAGNVFIAAIQWDASSLYRFQIAIPTNLPANEQADLLSMATSFRELSASDIKNMPHKKLVTVRSSTGASVAQLARKMPFDDGLNEQRFRMLNGLSSTEELRTGQIYKTIVQ